MITINLDKAREIHKDKLREARGPKLSALDVAFQRALEAGENFSPIATEKQALRDVTKSEAILTAENTDQLKESWPTDLLGPSPYTPPV